MIDYDVGKWQVIYAFRLTGSVLPRAATMALMTLVSSIGMWFAWNGFSHNMDVEKLEEERNVASAVKVLSGILSFYLTFRASIAYNRYWEGATLLAQIRGAWTNAASSVFAFCSNKEDDKEKVQSFQNLFARLMSVMFAIAIQKIAATEDCGTDFEILDTHGIDKVSLDFLANSDDKIQVVLQWIQRLVVENIDKKTLSVAPPLATRIFQELGHGIVNVNNAQKLTIVPFPFCFAQVSTALLLAHMAIMVFVSPLMYSRLSTMSVAVYFSTMALWSINFIAAELERPFGRDENDIPIAQMQQGFNKSLCCMLEELAQRPPSFDIRLLNHSFEKVRWGVEEKDPDRRRLVHLHARKLSTVSEAFTPQHSKSNSCTQSKAFSPHSSIPEEIQKPQDEAKPRTGTHSEPSIDGLTSFRNSLRSLQDSLQHLLDASRLMTTCLKSGNDVPNRNSSGRSGIDIDGGVSCPTMAIAIELDADRRVFQARSSDTRHSPLAVENASNEKGTNAQC